VVGRAGGGFANGTSRRATTSRGRQAALKAAVDVGWAALPGTAFAGMRFDSPAFTSHIRMSRDRGPHDITLCLRERCAALARLDDVHNPLYRETLSLDD
jgi:hypothetical protein